MERLAITKEVYKKTAEQCQCGLRTMGPRGSTPARKTASFLTNAFWIAQELSRRCPNMHTHQHMAGGRAKYVARYSPGLCKAMCRGLAQEVECKNLGIQAVLEIKPLMSVSLATKEIIDHAEEEQSHCQEWLQAWDDVSGAELDSRIVQTAQAKELDYVRKKPVYIKIPRAEAHRKNWKIIETEWIDTN